jgi:UDP-N-acetylmuramate dehydrogenase
MSSIEDFNEILQHNKPLGELTWLKLGGPAQYFLEPRSANELVAIIRCCHENDIPMHLLGGGSNVLIRDDGVSGAVLHLSHESFSAISVAGTQVHAGAGALLSNVISHSVKAGLAGLENLTGIPGTIGGALKGEIFTRTDDELSFAYRASSINELAILDATFQLAPDQPEEITRRMRTLWIMKKATQPLSFQSAGCIFKNPRGLSAGALIEQAGLKGTRIGQAAISDRHANFIVTEEGATFEDVHRLINLAKSRVTEQFGVELELEIQVW